MPLFRRGPSKSERDAALALIRHLQTMYAYQQLTMERFNDALVGSGMVTPGNEMAHRTAAGQTTAGGVLELVMPALDLKRDVLTQMEQAHAAFGRPTFAVLQPAYDDGSQFLSAMRARAEAQRAGWAVWLADPGMTRVDTGEFDRVERAALDRSITSLNTLIKSAGLKHEAWLDVNCDAFNEVRRWSGLDPFTCADFRKRFRAGQVSGSARFFNA